MTAEQLALPTLSTCEWVHWPAELLKTVSASIKHTTPAHDLCKLVTVLAITHCPAVFSARTRRYISNTGFRQPSLTPTNSSTLPLHSANSSAHFRYFQSFHFHFRLWFSHACFVCCCQWDSSDFVIGWLCCLSCFAFGSSIEHIILYLLQKPGIQVFPLPPSCALPSGRSFLDLLVAIVLALVSPHSCL